MAIDHVKLLARLLEVTRNLGTMVDLETYLQSLLSAAIELTESKTAVLAEYDEAAQEFCFTYVPWFQRDTLLNAKIPLSGSVAGWTLSHAQPLMLNDIKNDATYHLMISAPPVSASHSSITKPARCSGCNF